MRVVKNIDQKATDIKPKIGRLNTKMAKIAKARALKMLMGDRKPMPSVASVTAMAGGSRRRKLVKLSPAVRAVPRIKMVDNSNIRLVSLKLMRDWRLGTWS